MLLTAALYVVASVGPGLTYPDKPTNCDDNKLEVAVEMYTRSFGLSVSNGVTVTTTTRTITETAYETGCPVPEYTTTAACTLGSGNPKRQVTPPGVPPPVPTTAPAATAIHAPALVARADLDENDDCEERSSAAVYFTDTANDGDILAVMLELGLSGLNYHEFRHDSLGTVFIYVENSPTAFLDNIKIMDGVSS